MAFKVSEMMGSINSHGGLVKSSKYDVVLYPPQGLVGEILTNDIRFMCESAQLPGLTFQTDEVRPSGYGNIEKRPYTTIIQDVNLSFYIDNEGRAINLFHAWQQAVYNFNGTTSPYAASQRGLQKWLFAYPKEYYGSVEIRLYDESAGKEGPDSEIIVYTLHEAYPLTVGEAQVSWQQSDQLLLLPVTMTFNYWTTQAIDPGSVTEQARTRAQALPSTQTRIDPNLSQIRERVEL
jgi:hypothetical protein